LVWPVYQIPVSSSFAGDDGYRPRVSLPFLPKLI
jgi:hypothetical protein